MDSTMCQNYALVRNDPSPFLAKGISRLAYLLLGISPITTLSLMRPRGRLFAISEEAVAPMRHDFPGILAHGTGCRFVRRVRAALVLTVLLLPSLTIAQTEETGRGLKIVLLEGAGAINNIRLHRARDPVVQVVDAATGAPVKDAAVTFLLPATGPGGAFAASGRTLTVLSDEKGLATGRGLVPNEMAGKFEILVTVSFHESSAKAVITQTNAEPAEEASKGSSKKFLLIALIGGAVAGGAFAAMGHGGSSTLAQSSVSSPSGAVIIPGVPVFQPPH